MLTKMSSSDEQRALADDRRKALLDYNTNMEGAWEGGKKEGFTIGKDEGIEIGKNEGIAIGKEQGALLAERKILKRLLSGRFGTLPPKTLQQIEDSNSEELEKWSMRILGAQTIDDVFIP